MANTGALTPSSFASSDLDSTGTTAHWSNPSNAGASDNTYTTLVTVTTAAFNDYLVATNLSSPIPSGATIDGVLVEVEIKSNTASVSSVFDCYLIKGGAKTGSNKGTNPSAVPYISTTESYLSYGGAADLWGATLADTDVNASNFGVCIRPKKSSGKSLPTTSVDHIRMTIYYTGGGASFIAAQQRPILQAVKRSNFY